MRKSNLQGWRYVHEKHILSVIEKILTVIAVILGLAVVMMFVLFPVPKEVVATEEVQDVNLDAEVIGVIESTCLSYHICPELVEAMIEAESTCDAKAISPSGKHYGLMQVGISHADDYEIEADDLFNPYVNVRIGVDILYDLFEEYEDLPVVLMKYQGFSDYDAITLAVEDDIPAFTQKIIDRSMELERLHGK